MSGHLGEIRIADSVEALSRDVANEFITLAVRAVNERDLFTVALAGGSTPRLLYELLGDDPALREMVPWPRTHFFWGDERLVPWDHPDSNYGMACRAMLSKVPVSASHVHRVHTEHQDALRVAADYEEELRTTLGAGAGRVPRLDLVLLGLGTDGHTASLFPGTGALEERMRLVVANWVETLHAYRITMTIPVLNAAACVAFLVSGAEKASVLTAVLEDSGPDWRYPAQLVRPTDGRLIWFADRAAAGHLQRR